MAEAFALAASVIAVVQITAKITTICRFCIATMKDAPLGLRTMLREITALNSTFEALELLIARTGDAFEELQSLRDKDGPVAACENAVRALEQLFPKDLRNYFSYSQARSQAPTKFARQNLKPLLALSAFLLKQHKAKQLIEEIAQHKTTVNLKLSLVSLQQLAEMHRHNVYQWLEQINPSPLHNRAYKLLEAGTGDWLLQSQVWVDWVEAKLQTIWIHGIPGAGKTILMSHLFEELKKRTMTIPNIQQANIYYYCFFEHNQNEAGPFLRWILTQLCRQRSFITFDLQEMYKGGTEPSILDLLNALEKVLKRYDVAYVFIDALDESNPRKELLKVVLNLGTNPRFRKLQLVVSSREYADIQMTLKEVFTDISMDNPAAQEDILRYVRSALKHNPKFRHWPPDLVEEVEVALSIGAKGMFRWAVCQLDVLQRLKGEARVIRKALPNLPKTLFKTYDRILHEIPEEERLFIYHALLYMCFYQDIYGDDTPITVLLEAARIVTIQADPSQEDMNYDLETFRDSCGCLVNIASGTAARFAHFTVREYLDSPGLQRKLADLFPDSEQPPVSGKAHREMLVRIYLAEAQATDTMRVFQPSTYEYCVETALLSVRKWDDIIVKSNDLAHLATSLFDPSGRHFNKMTHMSKQFADDLEALGWPQFALWCNILWKTKPYNRDFEHLFYLLLIFSDKDNAQGLQLARLFIENRPSRLFLTFQTDFVLRVTRSEFSHANEIFDGTLCEIFAQYACRGSGPLYVLLEYVETQLQDSDRMLLSFMHSHSYYCKDHHNSCLLERFLQAGADPHGRAYSTPPLQIATACEDLEAAEILLKAGASPEDTGNPDGEAMFDPILKSWHPKWNNITLYQLRFMNGREKSAFATLFHKYGYGAKMAEMLWSQDYTLGMSGTWSGCRGEKTQFHSLPRLSEEPRG